MSQVLFSIPAALYLKQKWVKGTAYFEEDGFQFSSPAGSSYQQHLLWKDVKYEVAEEKIAGLSLLSAKKLSLKISSPEGSLPKLALDLDAQSKLQGSLDRLIVDSKSRNLEQQMRALKGEQKASDAKKSELGSLQTRLDHQRRELMDQQTRLEEQSLSQEKRQLELDALEKAQKENESRIARKEKELESEKSSLEIAKKDLEAERQSLQKERISQEKRYSKERKEWEAQKDSLEQSLKEQAEERENLFSTLQSLQDQQKEMEAQAQEVTRQNQELSRQNQEWQSGLQELEKEKLDLLKDKQELEKEKLDLLKDKQKLEKERDELSCALQSLAGQPKEQGEAPQEDRAEPASVNEEARETVNDSPQDLSLTETSISASSLQMELEISRLNAQVQELQGTCSALDQKLQDQAGIQDALTASLESQIQSLEKEKQEILQEKRELESTWEERLEEELNKRMAQLTYPNPPENPEEEGRREGEGEASRSEGDTDEPSLPEETGQEEENPSAPKVIAFINMKGGVAKTTTLVGLATLLAGTYNKKVLVIDLDPQTNCTTMLIGERKWIEVNGKTPEENKTLYRLYKDAIDGENLFSIEECLQKGVSDIKSIKTIDLLPSSLNTVELEERFYKIPEKRRYQLIREAIRDIRADYDYILIDCPPNLGPITLNGLAIAGAYVIPAIPDNLSTYGIPQIIARIHKFSQKIHRDIKCLGIVATKVAPNFATHKRILKAYSDPGPLLRQVQRIENNPDAQPITLFDTTFKENNFVSSAGEYQELGVSTVRKKWGYQSQNGQYDSFEAFAKEVMARAEKALGE